MGPSMLDDILARIFGNQWAVFLVVITLMLAFAEMGFRLGLQLHTTKVDLQQSIQPKQHIDP